MTKNWSLSTYAILKKKKIEKRVGKYFLMVQIKVRHWLWKRSIWSNSITWWCTRVFWKFLMIFSSERLNCIIQPKNDMLYWYALIRYVSLLSSCYSILELLRTIQMLGHTIVRLMIYMHIWLRAKYTKSKISSPKKISEVFIDYFIWEFIKTRYATSFDSLKI